MPTVSYEIPTVPGESRKYRSSIQFTGQNANLKQIILEASDYQPELLIPGPKSTSKASYKIETGDSGLIEVPYGYQTSGKTHSITPSHGFTTEVPSVTVQSRDYSTPTTISSHIVAPSYEPRSRSHSNDDTYTSYRYEYDAPSVEAQYKIRTKAPSGKVTYLSEFTGKNANLKQIVLEASDYKPELLLPHTKDASSKDRVIIKETIRPPGNYESPNNQSSFSSRSSSKPSTYRDDRITFKPRKSEDTFDSYRAERYYVDTDPSIDISVNRSKYSSSPSASFKNQGGLRQIITEVMDHGSRRVRSPRDYEDRRVVTEQSRSGESNNQPTEGLLSALSALTSLTAMGNIDDKSDSIIDMRYQGIYLIRIFLHF